MQAGESVVRELRGDVLPLHAGADTHPVAMRDGVRLATDVYLPEGDGPWPVIFLRFPYNKALGGTLHVLQASWIGEECP